MFSLIYLQVLIENKKLSTIEIFKGTKRKKNNSNEINPSVINSKANLLRFLG